MTVAANNPTSPVPTPASRAAVMYQNISAIFVPLLVSKLHLWYHGKKIMSSYGGMPDEEKVYSCSSGWRGGRDLVRQRRQRISCLPGTTVCEQAGCSRLGNQPGDSEALQPDAGSDALPAPPQDVGRGSIQILSENGVPLQLTMYQPQSAGQTASCPVYFHGGGFCVRDAGYIHRYAAQYAQGVQCKVVFVHYRTADEAPFPVDCYAALCWVWAHSGELGIDREHIAVGGDSAGGALAIACTLRARTREKYACASRCWSIL